MTGSQAVEMFKDMIKTSKSFTVTERNKDYVKQAVDELKADEIPKDMKEVIRMFNKWYEEREELERTF